MKPIYRLLIVLLIVTACSSAVHYFLKKGHRKAYLPFYEKLDEVTSGRTNYDILLLGNSKVQFGMNPYIIDSVLSQKSYNIGFAAAGFATQHALLQSYLHSHKAPRAIIWCVQESMFYDSVDIGNHFVYHDYLSSPIIEQLLDTLNENYRQASLFAPLRYVQWDDYNKVQAIRSLHQACEFTAPSRINYKGFSIDTSSSSDFQFVPLPNFDSSNLKKRCVFYFEKIAALCKSHKIKVLLVWPPNANNKAGINFAKRTTDITYIIDTFCASANTRYVRLDTTNCFAANEFTDGSHLNYKGSVRYSKMVAQLLDSLVLKSH